MAARADHDRAYVLARRVRWLDRNRRRTAIACGVLAGLFVLYELALLLDAGWRFQTTALAVPAGVVGGMTWWVVEVWLAWVTAVYETKWDRLMRDRSLPRAELVRWR